MPYNKSTGLMTSPLNTYDIADATGMPSNASIGDCIASGYINKWSKNKPIVWDKYTTLIVSGAVDERIGRTQEIGLGYFYGVKIGSRNGQGASILGLHDVRFDYLRPADHFRIMDFVGYSKYAAPTVYCTMPNAGYNDTERGLVFDIEYRSGNTVGVDISEAVKAATGFDVLHCYPCVLLSNTARTTNYVCVLHNDSGGVSYVTERNRTYYADLRSVGGVKLTSGNYTITTFLYNPSGLSSSFKTDGTWFAITSDQLWAGRSPIAIPSDYEFDCGKTISVSASDTRPSMSIKEITIIGTRMTIKAEPVGGGTGSYSCVCTPTIITSTGAVFESVPKTGNIIDGEVEFGYNLATDFIEIMPTPQPLTYTLRCVFDVTDKADPATKPPKQSVSTKDFQY